MSDRLNRTVAGFVFAFTLASPTLAQNGEEVPFITSPDSVTQEMLRLARVGPADHVIDLGSGDGRIVILAAKHFGASGTGVEIVPELVEQSRRHARQAGVSERVDFRVQDLFQTDLSRASVITMYLLPEVNLQLRPALLQLKPGTRLVSHDWDMGDWAPDQATVVPVPDKRVGLEKTSKVMLWVVPARVDGLWCGVGALRDFSLQITQRFQRFEARLARRGRVRIVTGTIEGATLRTEAHRQGSLELEQVGDVLRVSSGTGAMAPVRGQSFARAVAGACSD